MMMPLVAQSGIGTVLADRLGLKIIKTEGHDLAGQCEHCGSSDAFRLHAEKGIAQCYSCGSKWSPYQLAEEVLGNADEARALMIDLGEFQPSARDNSKPQVSPPDPITTIARQKHVPVASLKAYGAEATSTDAIVLPAYGPDGAHCTSMSMSARGGKGKFAYGKPAGLFFPHDENGVRLPRPGEIWHLVEGPKDAAALHGMGLLAAGLNTCRLAPKFARLFTNVDVILVPDRDMAGEQGAEVSARVLHGIASSVRIAVLPAEFKNSGGDDVRDVLRRPDGRQLVEQAIADAKLVEKPNDSSDAGDTVSATIELPEGEPLLLVVSPTFGTPKRLIVAQRGEVVHQGRIDTDSVLSRTRFVKKLARTVGVEQAVLAPLVEPQLATLADQAGEATAPLAMPGGDEQQSQATMATQMAEEWETWHTPDNVAYVTIPVGDHEEHWPVGSRTVKQHLAKRFYEEYEKAIGSDALSSAVNVIEAKALFDGEEHEIHVRVAKHDGNVYVDLCDDDWRVVEVTPNGWQVIDKPPVKFLRSRGMLSLPEPERGGTIEELRNLLNVDDASWVLLVAWLIGSLHPDGPFAILALVAEQGAGKSTVARLLRALIDPNSAPLRAEPRNGHDLMIAANNSRCLSFDNLSRVPSWLSDALCRLSTGGGYATRELYSNLDEVIFDLQRPVLLTSIEEVATRSDLLERCLIVSLPTIPEHSRRPEAELIEAFEKARPRILGAILNAIAGALRDLPDTKLSDLPRMADFALWVTAAEKALEWTPGTFLSAYRGNRESANDLALESSPVGQPVLDLLQETGEWCGTSGELLEAIEARVNDQTKRQKSWPKSPRSMSGHLKRLSPNLRAAGWDVQYNRKTSRRLYTIQQLQSPASSDSFASSIEPHFEPPPDCDQMQSDANSCQQVIDDANDGHDANLGAFSGDGEPNGDAADDVPF